MPTTTAVATGGPATHARSANRVVISSSATLAPRAVDGRVSSQDSVTAAVRTKPGGSPRVSR